MLHSLHGFWAQQQLNAIAKFAALARLSDTKKCCRAEGQQPLDRTLFGRCADPVGMCECVVS